MYLHFIQQCKFEHCELNRLSLEAELESRIHVVTLKCKDASNKKIIVGSCHLPYKTTLNQRKQNAELLFKTLNKLQQYSKCPLLIAGDFNYDLQRHHINRQKFELPAYEITDHRRTCIDYFAYKNYDDHVNIQLNNVEADTIVDSGSHHDPIRATMTISTRSYWNLLSFNMNKNESEKIKRYFGNLKPQPNIWFLHDINTPQNFFTENFTTHLSCSPYQTLLIFNMGTFQIQQATHSTIRSVKAYIYEVCYQGYKIIVALCHKLNDITREDIEKLFTTLNGRDCSVIVVGDFNIYKILKEHPDLDKRQFKIPKYKPTIYRAIYGGIDDACIDFFAYKNVTSNDKAVLTIANVTVTAEMIKCPGDIITEVDGQYYVDTENPALAELQNISPHDPLRVELLMEIKLLPLQLIYINITNTRCEQVADNIIGYCRNLNPKPDLYIFLNLTEHIATRIEYIDEYEYPTFITSRQYISFENETERSHGDLELYSEYEIGDERTCTFEHWKTTGSPKITIASINNLRLRYEIYDIERYFDDPSQNEYPTLIVGDFGVDLLTEDVHKYGFKVANHHFSTGKDFFTYKNSITHSSAIVLHDVYTDRTANLGFYVMKATMDIKVKPTIPL